jgi:hypothetical protein
MRTKIQALTIRLHDDAVERIDVEVEALRAKHPGLIITRGAVARELLLGKIAELPRR